MLDLINQIREKDGDLVSEDDELLTRAVNFYLTSPYRGLEDLNIKQIHEAYLKRDNFKNKSSPHKKAYKRTIEKLI